jgi:hypothetical protein
LRKGSVKHCRKEPSQQASSSVPSTTHRVCRMDYVPTFGKHKGIKLSAVPDDYLRCLATNMIEITVALQNSRRQSKSRVSAQNSYQNRLDQTGNFQRCRLNQPASTTTILGQSCGFPTVIQEELQPEPSLPHMLARVSRRIGRDIIFIMFGI